MNGAREGAGPSAGAEGDAALAALLIDRGLASREALERARLVQRQSGERLDAVLTSLGMISESALGEALAAASGLALAGSDAFAALPALAEGLAPAFLRDVRAVAIAADAASVTVAVVDPFDAFVAPAFAYAYQRPAHRVVARRSDLLAAIERLGEGAADETEDGALDIEDMDRLRDLVSDAPAIRAVNRLIAQAVDLNASDIHLEPAEDCLIVRLRIDGLLREHARLPQALRDAVVARIKVLARLDLAERRLPQDGRLRLAVRGHDIDLRVATAPSIHGESVVMRILDRSHLALDFDALGFDLELSGQLRKAVHQPHGIVLVTGPTGSGKTTTLYAALAELNRVERKLLTVEDPIEYRLPGVIQAQVQPAIGFTFASALRSFLRQDPDVIMVGEIRDAETAEVAVQAALTGHMILSTLHTNTAAGAIGRLLDMGVEPFLLGSVLSGVLAQRLVRRLCPQCKVVVAPTPEIAALLGGDVGQVHEAKGCPACQGTGYSGRIALLEFLPVTPAIAQLVLHRADSAAIEREARAAGARSLVADGYDKVAAGVTTVEEVWRAAAAE